LCLLSPLEVVLFFEDLKEWESPDAESQNEPTEGSHEPHQLLDIMKALGRLHLGDSRHLLRVHLYFEFAQVIKGLCQVRDESFFFLSLYDHVVNIHFCVAPNLCVHTVVDPTVLLHPHF
jgi:hypothetical protein